MIRKIIGQGIFYILIAVALGYLSASPTWTHLPEDQAVIKISFSHGAERKIPCHKRTREELMALAPNMRNPISCTRERLPVYVEINIDGDTLVAEALPPMGLAKDGQSKIYRRIAIAPGAHRLEIGIRDTDRASGFDYELRKTVDLVSRQNLIVDFEGDKGIFLQNERMAP